MLVEGPTWVIGGTSTGVAYLKKLEMSQVRSNISVALSKSKGLVSDAKCGVQDGFPSEASFTLRGLSAGFLCVQHESLVVLHLFFLLHPNKHHLITSLISFFRALTDYSISSIL